MLRIFLFCLFGLTLGAPAFSAEPDMKQLKADLVRAIPEFSGANIRPSSIPGLNEIELDSQIFYVTSDGKYFLMGDMLEVATRANLTEAKRETLRTSLLNNVGEANMIVMGPKDAKHTITVFTDVDCPYCATLHRDVPELTKQGVKVRYLMFPRAGAGSETFKRSVAVWCAADRVKAVGIAKAGGKLDMKTCANPVADHYALGERLGVTGTPTMFLNNGKRVPGYVPAQRLLAMFGIKTEAPPAPAPP